MDIEQKSTQLKKSEQKMNKNQQAYNFSNVLTDNNNISQIKEPEMQLYQPQVQFQKQKTQFKIQSNRNRIQFVGKLEISDNICIIQFINTNVNNQILKNNGKTEDSDLSVISIQYRVAQTLGTSGTTLMIFINSDKNKQYDEQQENPADQLIELMKTQKKGNFLMRGQCTIFIQFHQTQKKQMQRVFQLMSLHIEEQDEGASQYDDDEDMEEMISADNIDEFGNIVGQQQEQSNEESGENGQQQSQKMEDQLQNR